jgi:DNA processing protein
LITARLAGEQGRDVMAVPGHPLDPRASGPNHLIREGATLVRSASDALEILMNFSGHGLREPLFAPPSLAPEYETPASIPENATGIVLQNLSFTPVSVDELLRSCHLSIGAVQTVLLELDLAGRIKRMPGNRVCLI